MLRNRALAATAPPFTQYAPLAASRRHDGAVLLLLALCGLLIVAVLLLAQVPASLRASTMALDLILVVITLGTGILGEIWAWVIAWPQERRRLSSATPLGRVSELPPPQERPKQAMTMIIGGGLLVGALLWTVLNTLGFVAAPLLWCTLGAINLELARRVRQSERRDGTVYFDLPARSLLGGNRRLYVLSMP